MSESCSEYNAQYFDHLWIYNYCLVHESTSWYQLISTHNVVNTHSRIHSTSNTLCNPIRKPLLQSLFVFLLSHLCFLCGSSIKILWHQWLNVPNSLSILVDATITAEETHSGNTLDTLANPLILVLVCLVDQSLSLNVAVEIVGNEVVITVILDGADKCAKGVGVTKHIRFDGLEDLSQTLIKGM